MLGPHKSRDLKRAVVVSREQLVLAGHFFRYLETELDRSFIRRWVKECYAANGRPSVDAMVFLKRPLALCFEGLRLDRHLIQGAADHLSQALAWNGLIPAPVSPPGEHLDTADRDWAESKAVSLSAGVGTAIGTKWEPLTFSTGSNVSAMARRDGHRYTGNWMMNDEPEISVQVQLQSEARDVVDHLQLTSVLSRAGTPVQLGSSVLGLMTWRDIDFHVYCDRLDPEVCHEVLAPVAGAPGLLRLAFSNRLGDRRQLNEPDGYYSGIRYISTTGNEWKIDVWFLKSQPFPPEIEMMRQIHRRLTPETRLAILRLKSLWQHAPSYRDTVTSMDVYEAVLDHGIERPLEFESYLRQAGKLE